MNSDRDIVQALTRDVDRLAELSPLIRKALENGELAEVESGLVARDHLVTTVEKGFGRLQASWIDAGPEPALRRQAVECLDRVRALTAEGEQIRDAMAAAQKDRTGELSSVRAGRRMNRHQATVGGRSGGWCDVRR